MSETLKPTAIQWPAIQVGDERFILRYSYSTQYQLASWGKGIGTATNVELAAAMAGRWDERGRWRSAGFAKAVELADLFADLDPEIQEQQQTAMLMAITDAIKKAFPDLEVISAPPALDPGKTGNSGS